MQPDIPPPPTSSYASTQPGQFQNQPPRPPRRRLTRRTWLIIIAVFLVMAAIGGIFQALGITPSSDNNQTPQPTTQANQPTPTPAAKPSPTPQATLTTTQRIEQLVKSNASNTSKVELTANDGKTVSATLTLKQAPDNATYRTQVQQNCFAIEKALWTAKINGLTDVNLAFRGDAFPGPIAQCELTATSERGFLWDTLTAESVWDLYDVHRFNANISS